MLNKKTKIIIIGFGSIGKRHYGNLLELGYNNLTIFDPADAAFKGFIRVDRIKILTEKELKNFTIAFICGPNDSHLKHALMCAKAGCKIFIEKPLTHNLKDIEKLMRILKKNKIINMVACNMRFHPCLEFIKNYISKNKLGKIYGIKHEFGYYLPYWRPGKDYRKNYAAKKSTGGGIILDDIHEFDLLFWLNNFKKVKSVKFIYGKTSDLEIETEDFCLASFLFANKVIGSVQCDYLQKNYTRNCKVLGENGNLEWDFKENIVWLKNKQGAKKLFVSKKFCFNKTYIKEIKYFFSCLMNSQKTFNDVNAAAQILKYCIKKK
ncbi:MAG: Gfo/Idh/MocA family oxidoreductase [Patescibacteria group bacterium]